MLVAARAPLRTGPTPLRNGLVGAIRFGCGSRDAVRGVLSSSNLDRTTNSSVVSTKYGEAIYLNGTYATYNWGSAADTVWEAQPPFTFASFVMQTAYGSGGLGNNYTTNGYGIGQRFGNGTMRVAVNASNQSDSSSGVLVLNRPQVIVLACGPNGGTYQAFVDGKQQITGNVTTTPTYSNNRVGVGDRAQLNSSMSGAYFWWLLLWNRKLSPGEVRLLTARPMQLWEPEDPLAGLRVPYAGTAAAAAAYMNIVGPRFSLAGQGGLAS